MVSVHADWAIADGEAFRGVLSRAATLAATRASLVTVGVVPTRPDPGFGYIQPAEAVDGARRVARFTEKPDAALAERMIRDGFLWNSGIFVWRVGDFLDEVRAHTPEVAPYLGEREIVRFFAAVSPISVDEGVLERSGRVLVLPGDFGWDDVGTWSALARVRRLDENGNAVSGSVVAVASRGNVAHAEGNTIVLYGVSDLVVVTYAGITLVTTRERAANLKTLLDVLPPEIRDPS
jgi:mannose-1-phosphate guanylyltransferase